MKKKRLFYAVMSAVLLLIEIAIALWVTDDFIRPFGGDILVTLLLCCVVRVVFPEKLRWLSAAVFVFSVAVEIAQYFDYVALLGLADNVFLSILLGRSFAFADIVCYGVGCLAFALLDTVVQKSQKE